MNGGAAFIFNHVARHEVTAVGCRVEQNIGRAAFNPAIQHRFQRLVIGIFAFKRKIIAEHQAAPRPRAQKAQQIRQGLDVFAVDFNQSKAARHFPVGCGMRGLHQR